MYNYISKIMDQSAPILLQKREISSLNKVIGVILQEISNRKNIERQSLSDLDQRIMNLHNEQIRAEANHSISSLVQLVKQEGEAEIQKIKTKEQAIRDVIELKKVLWKNWLLLQEKEANLYILK